MSKGLRVCSLAALPCVGVLYSPVETHFRNYVAAVQTAHKKKKKSVTLFSAQWQISHQKNYTQ